LEVKSGSSNNKQKQLLIFDVGSSSFLAEPMVILSREFFPPFHLQSFAGVPDIPELLPTL